MNSRVVSVGKEAIIIGLGTALIGAISFFLLKSISFTADLNQWPTLFGYLFVVGVIIHVICEIAGVNHWYCSNGAACQTSLSETIRSKIS